MQSLPITVDRYFFTRFCVESNPNHVQLENQRVEASVDSRLQINRVPNSPDVYVAEQKVKIDANSDTSIPYSIDVECIGFFKVEDPSLGEEERKRGVTILAHTVLYASVRDAVLAATARQPWGPFSIGISVLKSREAATLSPPTSKPAAKSKRKKTTPQ